MDYEATTGEHLLLGPHFRTSADVKSVPDFIEDARRIKRDPSAWASFGAGHRLGLVFLNPSLRTRLSTEIAARNLGMEVQVLNMAGEAWALEYRDSVRMDADKAEHVREAAGVLGEYMDIIGLRSFPGLKDAEEDAQERIQSAFIAHSKRPLLSLESATAHPLQGFADVITIRERMEATGIRRPKVVLAWAPHVKALPQAVPNSFVRWCLAAGHDLHIAHPEGLDLDPSVTDGATIHHDLEQGIADADFIYVKNWSMREPYGKRFEGGASWMLDLARVSRHSPNAHVMHCLPVRRDVVMSADLLDSPRSLVLHQAHNRIWSAQAALVQMIRGMG
jgi:N-succinyl-L-ornithine transcarbamylase